MPFGTYSCAVDAFIEVSTELFLPHLSNLSVRNEFTALLLVHVQVKCSREKTDHCCVKFENLCGHTS